MTKGQNKTVEFIEQFVESNDSKFTWQELVNEIEASGATVKNWLSIRSVLQWFINEGLIERTKDVHSEEYINTKPQINTTCTRLEWIDFVDEFQENEGLITFYEAEAMVLGLIRDGKMQRPTGSTINQ